MRTYHAIDGSQGKGKMQEFSLCQWRRLGLSSEHGAGIDSGEKSVLPWVGRSRDAGNNCRLKYVLQRVGCTRSRVELNGPPNKTVQATPMNAAVLSLRSRAGLCHRYGVPDLFRSAQD